jgi:hypothetical protein
MEVTTHSYREYLRSGLDAGSVDRGAVGGVNKLRVVSRRGKAGPQHDMTLFIDILFFDYREEAGYE